MATSNSPSSFESGSVVPSTVSMALGSPALPLLPPRSVEIGSCGPMALVAVNATPQFDNQADTSRHHPEQPTANDVQRLLDVRTARQGPYSVQNGVSYQARFQLTAARRVPDGSQAVSVPRTRVGLPGAGSRSIRRGRTIASSGPSPSAESERRERELRAREDAKMSAAKRKMGNLRLALSKISSVTK